MNNLLFGALPYIALTILVGGTAYRYWKDERSWTSKSSEFLGKGSLKIAGPLFHVGLFMALGGHVIGMFVPKSFTDGVGLSEHAYHLIALGGGIPAGIFLCLGFFLLMHRRFDKARMKVNTSLIDGALYAVLFLTIATGFGGTLLSAVGLLGDDFNYRECISPWLRSVLMLNPDVSLMDNAPIIFKIHVLCAMATMIIFPISRLVHCISGVLAPVELFMRSPIIYRRK